MIQSVLANSNPLEQTEFFVTKVATEEFSNKLVYHDIEYVHRIITAAKEISVAEGIPAEEKEVVLLSVWLSVVGFKNLEFFKDINGPGDLARNSSIFSHPIAEEFLSSFDYADPNKSRVLNLILRTPEELKLNNDPDAHLAEIISDALTSDWASDKAELHYKHLYQELLLMEAIVISKSGWREKGAEYLKNHEYLTEYTRTNWAPKKEKTIEWLKEQNKQYSNDQKAIIKQELDISDFELKKLKKSLLGIKSRDDKGIQTMFRTTSRNHYTLNQMVDSKANIMISVNAIILSLIISRIMGQVQTWCLHNSPILIMLVTCSISIVFAVLAIRPAKSHGEFTEEEIRNRQGNLLYFGNYHNMSFRDYQWGMLQLIKDGDNLYTTMIRDLYFLGQMLERKYRHIRFSLNIFMIGFTIAVVLFVIASSMPDFHISGTH